MSTGNTTRYYKLDIITQNGDALSADNAEFTVTDENGDPVDLSVYASGTLKVYKKHWNLTTPVLIFDTADSSLLFAAGKFTLVLTSDINTLSRGVYYFQLEGLETDVTDRVLISKGQYIVQ